MRIYHEVNKDSPDTPNEDKEKIAILKLVDVGKYVKGVGIRDGTFYVIAENETDEIYLEYRQVMHSIDAAFKKRVDPRLIMQKTMEYANKKANAMQKMMEIPK